MEVILTAFLAAYAIPLDGTVSSNTKGIFYWLYVMTYAKESFYSLDCSINYTQPDYWFAAGVTISEPLTGGR